MRCCIQYHFHNIKRILKYLSQESTEMVVHAFTSRVDYCNSLLYGLPNYHLMQRVLNASACRRSL